MKKQELLIKICLGSEPLQQINTGIKVPRELEYYYIPDDYKNPTRVYLVDYRVNLSVDNTIMILAMISINIDKELEEIDPKYLFETKNQASDYYLKNKPNLNYLKKWKERNF